jgi:enoyl-CoA hydratase/carnithine racemase
MLMKTAFPRYVFFVVTLVALITLGSTSTLAKKSRVKIAPPDDASSDASLARRGTNLTDQVLGTWDFENPPGQGWTAVDATEQPGNFTHVDNFAGLAAPYFPLSGSKSLWCGLRPADCQYLALPGYGNGWDQRFTSVAFPSSGGDVFEIIEPLTRMNTVDLLDFTRMTGEVVKSMRACPQPIIAAIDGVCAGAGAIIAMASDLRIGTAAAKVAFLFNRVGLAGCDMGACAILPRIIGQGRASELLYTGRSMSGEEAERWGFFNRLASSETVLAEATELARDLASGPTFANGMTKRMLDMEWAMSIEAAIEAEAVAQALCMKTEDFNRAFRAFAAKQKPVFEGN